MAGLVPAIHILAYGASLKDVDARHKAGHDEEEAPRSLTQSQQKERQEVSAAFTRPLALAKSICPAYFAFSALMTLPMSLMPAAFVSPIMVEIAALTSSSDICFGR